MDIILNGLDENWSNAIKNLLFKKISDCCVLETRMSAPEIYKQFLNNVRHMGLIQQKMMFELMNPN